AEYGIRDPLVTGVQTCALPLCLLDGAFHEHVVEPLLRSPERMEGMARYLTGLTWEPVDALATEHGRLTMPVLLLWGADDPTFPRSEERRVGKGSRAQCPPYRLD